MSKYTQGDLVKLVTAPEKFVFHTFKINTHDQLHLVTGIEQVHNGDGSTSHYYDLLVLHKVALNEVIAPQELYYYTHFGVAEEDLEHYTGKLDELPNRVADFINGYIQTEKQYYAFELNRLGNMAARTFSKYGLPDSEPERKLTLGEL